MNILANLLNGIGTVAADECSNLCFWWAWDEDECPEILL